MKTTPCSLTIFILKWIVCSSALAAETPIDLTKADKAIQSFYAAVKEQDPKAVEAMLSPKIKKYITDGKFTIEEYIKAWNKHPYVKLGKAKEATFKGDTVIRAKAEIVFLLDGKAQKTSVWLIRLDDRWLWDEK